MATQPKDPREEILRISQNANRALRAEPYNVNAILQETKTKLARARIEINQLPTQERELVEPLHKGAVDWVAEEEEKLRHNLAVKAREAKTAVD